MKKVLKIIVLHFIAVISIFSQGEMEINPEKPKAYDELEIIYKPADKFIQEDSLWLFVYFFDEYSSLPYADSFLLRKDTLSDAYTTKFRNPDQTVFAILKVGKSIGNYLNVDNNEGKYWDYLVHNNQELPKKSALLKASLSYLSNMNLSYQREPDFDLAQDLLEAELEFYPKNIEARIGYHTLLYDMRKITESEYKKSISDDLDLEYDKNSENDIRAVTRALRVLNKNDNANQLERIFIGLNPQSKLAEEFMLTQLAAAESLSEFRDIALDYFELFPNTEKREQIFNAFATAFLQIGEINQLLEYLEGIESVPNGIYSYIAIEILKTDRIMKNLSFDEKLGKVLDIYHRSYNDSTSYEEFYSPIGKPKDMTLWEWQIQQRGRFGAMIEIGGNIYLSLDLDKSKKYYLKALDYLQELSRVNIYENLIRIEDKKLNYSSGLQFIEKAILNSNYSELIEEKYFEFRKKLGDENLNEKVIGNDLDSLLFQAQLIRRDRLSDELIRIEDISGYFKSLDNRIIEIQDLEGDVAMIYFFASWCGPCQNVNPAFSEIFDLYEDELEVEILALNVWEKTNERRKKLIEFIKDIDEEFPVFYDETDILPKRMGITGLPVIVFLDRNTNIRYKISGFTNREDFINKSIDLIEILKQEEFNKESY